MIKKKKESSLNEQFLQNCEPVKSGNLLLSTMREIISSPNLIRFVAGTALALASGYLTTRIVAGTSSIVLRKVFPVILRSGALILPILLNQMGKVIERNESENISSLRLTVTEVNE
jgi:hypothetical protein